MVIQAQHRVRAPAPRNSEKKMGLMELLGQALTVRPVEPRKVQSNLGAALALTVFMGLWLLMVNVGLRWGELLGQRVPGRASVPPPALVFQLILKQTGLQLGTVVLGAFLGARLLCYTLEIPDGIHHFLIYMSAMSYIPLFMGLSRVAPMLSVVWNLMFFLVMPYFLSMSYRSERAEQDSRSELFYHVGVIIVLELTFYIVCRF